MAGKDQVDIVNEKCLPLYHDLVVPWSQTVSNVDRASDRPAPDRTWWISNTKPEGGCTHYMTFETVLDSIVEQTDYIRYSTSMEDRFCLVATSCSVAREGEIKFNTVDDWRYDNFFQALDTPWVESKVQKDKYSCAHVNNAWSYLMDFYHASGSYMMLEGGFHYTETQILGNYLFPDLQDLNNEFVTSSLVTAIITRNMSDN